ncbi:MAG: hypothetical protein LBD05_02720 [Mycoplasmataceae bacterium]|jgi:hypothetical protein|nr:hypothetical protein [Mycoplasmataceae bacterium]
MKNINKYTILSSQNNKNLEKDIIVLEKMNKSDDPNNKPSKPKQPTKMELLLLTMEERINKNINEIRIEVNTRFDKIETRIDKIEAKLEEHSEIFERNNLH